MPSLMHNKGSQQMPRGLVLYPTAESKVKLGSKSPMLNTQRQRRHPALGSRCGYGTLPSLAFLVGEAPSALTTVFPTVRLDVGKERKPELRLSPSAPDRALFFPCPPASITGREREMACIRKCFKLRLITVLGLDLCSPTWNNPDSVTFIIFDRPGLSSARTL